MTVQELIERLEGLPGEMPVFLNCDGNCAQAAVRAWINLIDSAGKIIPEQQPDAAGYADVVLIEGANKQA